MSKNLIIVICVIAYVCTPHRCTEARSVPKISIMDEMKGDKEICKAAEPLRDSIFSKICETVNFPDNGTILKLNNSAQFLCLGLYERIVRLCYLGSLTNKSVLPSKSSDFDAEVRKTLPQDESGVFGFCSKWDNVYPPRYEKTKSLVAQLEQSLKSSVMCIKLCTDADGKLIPVCSSLATMDRMSKLMGEPQGGASGMPKAPQAVARDRPIVPVTTAPDNEAKAGAETPITQGKAEGGAAKASLDTSAGVAPEEAPKAAQPVNVAESKQETNPETTGEDSSKKMQTEQAEGAIKQLAENVATLGNSSVAAAGIPDRYKEMDESSKLVKVDTEEGKEKQSVEKTKPAGIDDSTKKAAALAPATGGAAGIGENRAADGEDVTGDSKTDVISQHTQDEPEDQFGAADPLDSIDPILIDNDDENSVKLTDKQPYIPRLPGIPDEDDSHFFGYFTFFGFIFIAGYFGYHNKQKILAMVLEGRRSRSGRSRKRPSTANYRKLDCTLEEAVTSQCNSNVTHVIY